MPIKYDNVPKRKAVIKKLRAKKLRNSFLAKKLKRTKQQISAALNSDAHPGLLIKIEKYADGYSDFRL